MILLAFILLPISLLAYPTTEIPNLSPIDWRTGGFGMIVMDIDNSGLPIQLETSKENEEVVKGPEEDSTTEESSSLTDGDNDIENIPPILRSGAGRRKIPVSTRNRPVIDILDIVTETEYTPVVDLFKSLKPIEEVEKDAPK
jgi:hypothetical protein